jgi:hypothetical protein
MRTFTVPLEVDLRRSLSPLVSSAQDPTIRLRPREVVRASATPDGPVTVHLVQRGGREFTAEAYGPGAAWALERAPALVGGDDHLDGFEPTAHRFVARAHHARRALRIVRTGTVWDLLVPTILAQRVTGGEAARAWTRLVRQHGEPAPGPFELRVAPSPAVCGALPDHVWHRLGVERSRAAAVRSAAKHAAKLERALHLPRDGPAPDLLPGPGHRAVDRRAGAAERGRGRGRRRGRRLPRQEPGGLEPRGPPPRDRRRDARAARTVRRAPRTRRPVGHERRQPPAGVRPASARRARRPPVTQACRRPAVTRSVRLSAWSRCERGSRVAFPPHQHPGRARRTDRAG